MRILITIMLLAVLIFSVSAPVFSLDSTGLLKSGLVGAATGAVAAGASHGQAGKGALIGAGTGIAAGVIADALIPDQNSAPAQAAPAPESTDSSGFERGYTKGYESGYQAGYQAGIRGQK